MLKKRVFAAIIVFLVVLLVGCSSQNATPPQDLTTTQPASSDSGSAAATAAANLPDNSSAAPQPEVLPQSPLQLIIDSPQEGDVLTTTEVQITGRTAPGAVVSGADAFTVANDLGQFTLTVVFEPGLQLIEIEASNTSGEDIIQTLSIDIQPE